MHCHDYLKETAAIALRLDPVQLEALATELYRLRRDKGDLYVLGLGGSLANAIHMAADLRKLCHISAYAPSNMAEITAWANDEGMSHIFTGWLRNVRAQDAILVLSVGGGTDEVSTGITASVKRAKEIGAKVFGIVGPVGGITAEFSDCCVKVPAEQDAGRITPHTEAFQAVIWHALVSHPLLQMSATKW